MSVHHNYVVKQNESQIEHNNLTANWLILRWGGGGGGGSSRLVSQFLLEINLIISNAYIHAQFSRLVLPHTYM